MVVVGVVYCIWIWAEIVVALCSSKQFHGPTFVVIGSVMGGKKRTINT